MNPQFFGNHERPLFCVHHQPRGGATVPARAVLICPPIGQEYVRSHWTLRLVANQLARKSIHVLRLDYEGIGDSASQPEDILSMAQWEANLVTSIQHLRSVSGANNVMVVGLRFGALLATRAATHSAADVNSVVSWEPVEFGTAYLNELQTMHRRMLDLWVCKMKTVDDESLEELLGSIYSRSLIDEIETVHLDYGSVDQPHLVVDLKERKNRFVVPTNSLIKRMPVDDEYSWSDPGQLEDAWLRPKTVRALVTAIDDMFARLERFGILSDFDSSTLPVVNEPTPTTTAGVQG